MGGKGSGRPPNPPTPRKMLKEVIPLDEIFTEEEIELYEKFVDVYLQDFEDEDMTSSDMDDLLDLAKNRVIEIRLLKSSKGDVTKQLDVAAALEKLGKKNEKIKESLSYRRKDRINPNEFKGFSIVDLATAFNNERKSALAEKAEKLKEREKEMLKKREEYTGNRYDVDVKEKEKEDG